MGAIFRDESAESRGAVIFQYRFHSGNTGGGDASAECGGALDHPGAMSEEE
jgi:hypothetical protein